MPQTATTVDAYRILQVAPHAEDAVVHAAYRALARRFHPDGEEPDPGRMRVINHAYQVLRDPERRRCHDLERLGSVAARAGRANGRDDAERDRGDVLDFGRYAGWRLRDLLRHDPDYLRWLSRHSSGIRYREAIAALLPGEPDLVRRSGLVA